jgi:hypothetical protein
LNVKNIEFHYFASNVNAVFVQNADRYGIMMNENKLSKSISKAGSKFHILLPILMLIRYGFTYILSILYCIIPISFQYAKLKFSGHDTWNIAKNDAK